MRSLVIFGLVALARAFPSPDDDAALLADIAAGIGERYQTEEQEVDRDFISNLFGTNNKPPYEIVEPDVETNLVEEQCHDPNKPTEDHSPSITVDDEARNCLEYADQGFRCVPYYSCEDGEIIIDGAGLFNPRFGGLDDVAVSPENSKCEGALEMCCRHPDWYGIPITEPVKIVKPPPSVLIPCPKEPECPITQPGCPGYVDPCPSTKPGCPGYVDPCPSTQAGCPGYVEPCPSTTYGCPGYVDPCPSTQVGCPGYVDPCPSTQAGCPGYVDPCPSTQAGCPGYVDPCPSTDPGCPGYVDPCPSTEPNCPGYVDPCPSTDPGCPGYVDPCPSTQVGCAGYVDPCPSTQEGCPGYVDPCPKTQAGCPGYIDPCPSSQAGCPGYVDPCPSTQKGCPGYVDPCPSTQAGCPGYVDPCPSTQAGCPGYVDPCPSTQAGCPGYVEPCPSTTYGCPGYVDPKEPSTGGGPDPAEPCDSSTPGCPGYEDSGTRQPVLPTPYTRQCGKRNIGGLGVRIQSNTKGDRETQFGEWPHMCAVLNRTVIGDTEQNLFVCGGSLIAPNVVLTAAHCVDEVSNSGYGSSSLMVRCGEWDTQGDHEPLNHQDRFAKEVLIHPGFVKRNLNNDVAIIVMQEEFILSQHIGTICLPNQDDYSNINWENCVATGWGKDEWGKSGRYQVIMKQILLDMVDRDTCENKLRTTRLGEFFKLHDSFSCAGGKPGEDACTGDGGGPLVCPVFQPQIEDDSDIIVGGRNSYQPEQAVETVEYEDLYNPDTTYIQTGIIAWGVECGLAVPGVYANVSKALCFIDYATRCGTEDPQADYYGMSGCTDWAKQEYCGIQDEIDLLRELMESTTVLREKGKYNRQIRNKKKLLPGFEDLLYRCDNPANAARNDFYVDCYPDPDANFDSDSYARIDELKKESK